MYRCTMHKCTRNVKMYKKCKNVPEMYRCTRNVKIYKKLTNAQITNCNIIYSVRTQNWPDYSGRGGTHM